MLSMGCILLLSGCGHKNLPKNNLETTDTTAAQESMSSTAKSVNPTKAQDSQNSQESDGTRKSNTASSVTAAIQTYQEKGISIQYPVVSNLSNSAVEEKVNALLKKNALEIQSAYPVQSEKDSLTVDAKVISTDRKRTTVVYTGSYVADKDPQPKKIYYTNTVDMTEAKDIGLTDYIDPNTLAKYILSEDCELYNASPQGKEAFLSELKKTSEEEYDKILQQADFPLQTKSSEGTPVFPQSFTYEDHGTIIISLPVPRNLGDFVLIKYTPETK